jgi:hypothetical protein
MNMTITESDKKLLSFLAAFLVAIAFVFLVFMPLSRKNKALEKELNEVKQQELAMDMSTAMAEDMEATEETVREETEKVLQRFYPMLQSNEAEDMVTILMLNHRLQIQNLSIVMPEKASTLKWYQYAEGALESAGDTEENTEEGNGEFGIYTARITCTAEGSQRNMSDLLDDISGNYPAISILSAEWQNPTGTADTDGSMTVTLEIYMCNQ